ncbi:hypothetical protein RFI_33729 [Reticulomyxa filosa]|uniref:Uncharacterized protein n=1 Tax=Reticulomyxa filosa TaxID=46433 RepID=X6LSE8_RETFI|nr:hypothetical protein RFI_33729 [Reticulomyxa filosa]|eukprot:ETO03675.1 hypothetical protein RFI_33729 [Reticulomyxa filosa]
MLGLEEDQEKTNTFKECYDEECEALLNEQHEDHQHALVIGKQCLKQYLNKYNNQHSVGNHHHLIRRSIGKKRIHNHRDKRKEMKDHLNNSYYLKSLMYKFKEFGCNATLFNFNFEQPLKPQMKRNIKKYFSIEIV